MGRKLWVEEFDESGDGDEQRSPMDENVPKMN